MKEYIKLAWRNLWRNRKRTAITSASILFAVFFALLMRSMQLGTYDNMIKNAIEAYMGFIQIQHVDYEDDPGLDNSFEYNAEVISKLEEIGSVKAIAPRIESFALASNGLKTKGVMILGVDIEREKDLSKPNEKLVKYRITKENMEQLKKELKEVDGIAEKLELCINNSYSNTAGLQLDLDLDGGQVDKFMPKIEKITSFSGRPLKSQDNGVLVSDRLSKFLKLNVGDTLVLMGQGYHGTSAAGLFPIRGIIKIPAPDLDNKLIYMTLNSAKNLFSMGDNITTVSINLYDNSNKNLIANQQQITKTLNNKNLTVRNWKEFNEVLFQQIESDNQSGKAMLGLLYFIIFFGIFGTVLMMIHERYKEFGVLVAVGMQKTKLAIVLVIEMFFMGVIGVFSGILISLPLMYLGHNYPLRLTGDLAAAVESMGMEPVMPLAWIDMYVLWQGVIVALMVVLSCLYPLRKVLKLKEVQALRS